MNDKAPKELVVKDRYQDCKGFECPRLLELCETGEDGRRYFTDGDLAYTAMVRCNNWAFGLSDGDCPIEPSESEAK